MYKVTKEVKWEAAHRLLGYKGSCGNIHGHSYKAIFTFEAKELDEMGMVLDFSYIKREIKNWIDINWDHSLILYDKDPLVRLLSEKTKIFTLQGNPTAENMAKHLFHLFYIVTNWGPNHFGSSIQQGVSKIKFVSVEVFETLTSSAIYEK
jgi:6-pyruvoyltetrahydropterin/6-carboxytetrahydropterin synthase